MDVAVAILGSAGAWLLFAGPLLQAALELRDESVRQQESAPDASRVGKTRVSAWWWALPPVAIWQHLALRRKLRQQQLATMTAEEARASVLFSSKAVAWLLVASGALLIAVKETWEAGGALGGSVVIRCSVIVVIAALVALGAAVHMAREGTVLLQGAPSGGRRGAMRAAADPGRPQTSVGDPSSSSAAE